MGGLWVSGKKAGNLQSWRRGGGWVGWFELG